MNRELVIVTKVYASELCVQAVYDSMRRVGIDSYTETEFAVSLAHAGKSLAAPAALSLEGTLLDAQSVAIRAALAQRTGWSVRSSGNLPFSGSSAAVLRS